jgi:hypothetical protein
MNRKCAEDPNLIVAARSASFCIGGKILTMYMDAPNLT